MMVSKNNDELFKYNETFIQKLFVLQTFLLFFELLSCTYLKSGGGREC